MDITGGGASLPPFCPRRCEWVFGPTGFRKAPRNHHAARSSNLHECAITSRANSQSTGRRSMRNNSESARAAGLLLLLLLRQASARRTVMRSTIPPKPSLESSAIYRGPKPPIAYSRRRRLPISLWQTNFWTKTISARPALADTKPGRGECLSCVTFSSSKIPL